MQNHQKFTLSLLGLGPARALGLSLLSLVALGHLSACSSDDGDSTELCAGVKIEPHVPQVPLGQMYPTPAKAEDRDLASRESTPYEWVLRLRSKCDEPVKVTKVCLVGDSAKNGADVEQFTLEGPKPTTIDSTFDGAIRITYKRQMPNSGDDIDNVAVVIQSNAANAPTLVVPVCASVVKDGQERTNITCTAPVTVAEGQKDEGLCP